MKGENKEFITDKVLIEQPTQDEIKESLNINSNELLNDIQIDFMETNEVEKFLYNDKDIKTEE